MTRPRRPEHDPRACRRQTDTAIEALPGRHPLFGRRLPLGVFCEIVPVHFRMQAMEEFEL
jgi:hypothetical protein